MLRDTAGRLELHEYRAKGRKPNFTMLAWNMQGRIRSQELGRENVEIARNLERVVH